MATNANLQYSRREKQDEFYAQYSTIEEELWFYLDIYPVFQNISDFI